MSVAARVSARVFRKSTFAVVMTGSLFARGAALAADNFVAADISGVKLGMPLDTAVKSGSANLRAGKPQFFQGHFGDGPASTPQVTFGAFVQAGQDQLQITNSVKPGVGVVAITHSTDFYHVTEPTIASYEQALAAKYGQPTKSYVQFGMEYMIWTLNSSASPGGTNDRGSVFCTQAVVGASWNEVQNRMAKGNYSIPYGPEEAKCGTWMGVRIQPEPTNRALVYNFSTSIVDFVGLTDSQAYAHVLLNSSTAAAQANEDRKAASVRPKL